LLDAAEKLSALEEKIEGAKAEGKKTAKLEAQKAVLDQRIAELENAAPIVHQKPHDQEIAQIRKRLRQLEMKANGPKATLDDISRLAAIGPNLKADIAALEEEDRVCGMHSRLMALD
jgi:glucose-6-phosphate isomerase